jgi:hypothetical protein
VVREWLDDEARHCVDHAARGGRGAAASISSGSAEEVNELR